MKLRYILSEDVNIQKHQAQLDAVSKRVGIPQEDLINYVNEMDPSGKHTRLILKQITEVKSWPTSYIMKESKSAYVRDLYHYAKDIIKGPWSEAEPIIMTDPYCAYDYVQKIMGGKRWPEAEPYMMKEPELAYYYARNILKGPWPEAEPYIVANPGTAHHYARFVIQGRWPEAEPYIMKDPMWAYNYALNLMDRKRWPEAEPYIMSDPKHIYYYAKDIIRGPWPEAEPYIKQNPYWYKLYIQHIKPKITKQHLNNPQP